MSAYSVEVRVYDYKERFEVKVGTAVYSIGRNDITTAAGAAEAAVRRHYHLDSDIEVQTKVERLSNTRQRPSCVTVSWATATSQTPGTFMADDPQRVQVRKHPADPKPGDVVRLAASERVVQGPLERIEPLPGTQPVYEVVLLGVGWVADENVIAVVRRSVEPEKVSPGDDPFAGQQQDDDDDNA